METGSHFSFTSQVENDCDMATQVNPRQVQFHQSNHDAIADEPPSQLSNLAMQSSQTLLAHEEIVSATVEEEIVSVKIEVSHEVQDFLSEYRPEGWVELDTRMEYHTNEVKWGAEGVPEVEMEKISGTGSIKLLQTRIV